MVNVVSRIAAVYVMVPYWKIAELLCNMYVTDRLTPHLIPHGKPGPEDRRPLSI